MSQPRPLLVGLSILIVDDDADTRELMELVLAQEGAAVRSASSAIEGFELFKAAPPAVVLADIAMAQHDGLWLFAQTRSLEGVPPVPFIAFTALAMRHERERILAAGFAAHIVKPVEPENVVRAIRQVTGTDPGM